MRRILPGLVAAAVSLAAGAAQAGYKLEVDEFRWISLGIGARVEAGGGEDAHDDWTKSFRADSIRPYLSGQVHEYVKWEANLDYNSSDNDVQLLDGVIKLELDDALNLWAGRFLPPTDRANFSGPYFLNTWAFPGVAHRYPAIFAGRDDGVAVWGQTGGGRFKYQLGAFQGLDEAKGPQYNARLAVNLLDPEPGYYNASTYFGERDVLALGGVVYAQGDGAGTSASGSDHDFFAWNVDLLFEKSLGDAGTPMIDAGYYDYDNDDFPAAESGVRADGQAFYVTAGWYLPGEFGIGKLAGLLQPHVRYQEFDAGDPAQDEERWDAGLNWYLDAHDAKLVVFYSNHRDGSDGGRSRHAVHIGLQLQF